MKKLVLCGVLLLVSLCMLCFASAEKSFNLPSSLTDIDESGFEGTAAEIVVLPESARSIGERAFARMSALSDVYIPAGVELIADDAFAESAPFTVHGVSGSKAHDWAKSHGLPFVNDDIWQRAAERNRLLRVYLKLLALLTAALIYIKALAPNARKAGEGASKRPQERAELYAVQLRFP